LKVTTKDSTTAHKNQEPSKATTAQADQASQAREVKKKGKKNSEEENKLQPPEKVLKKQKVEKTEVR